MPAIRRFAYDRPAVARIVEAGGGLQPFDTLDTLDKRSTEELFGEVWAALNFAGERLGSTYVCRQLELESGAIGRPQGRPRAIEIEEFVERLLSIWPECFNGRFITRFDPVEARAYGPLIGFLLACFEVTAEQLERAPVVWRGQARPNHTEALIGDLRATTASALRHRVQKSSWLQNVRAMTDHMRAFFAAEEASRD